MTLKLIVKKKVSLTRFFKILFILLLVGQTNKARALENTPSIEDSLDCLKLIVKTASDGFVLRNCAVLLFLDNELVDSANNSLSKQVFILKRDKYYTVRISKEGYIDRSIALNTTLPKNKLIKRLYQNEIIVSLPNEEEKSKLNDYYLDFPIAIIKYNETKDLFEHGEEYTKLMKLNSISKKKPKIKKSTKK